MEAALAMRIGVKENRIIWNGPIKNKEKLESFLLAGGTVNIDSIDEGDRKSTRLNSSHMPKSRMPSSA